MTTEGYSTILRNPTLPTASWTLVGLTVAVSDAVEEAVAFSFAVAVSVAVFSAFDSVVAVEEALVVAATLQKKESLRLAQTKL